MAFGCSTEGLITPMKSASGRCAEVRACCESVLYLSSVLAADEVSRLYASLD